MLAFQPQFVCGVLCAALSCQVSNRVPFVADLKPSGKYVMEDLQSVGGIPAVLKMLLEAGLIDGSCLTVTGK